VQLGKILSIETFAEGIEQETELSLLKDENYDSGQGFLSPVPSTWPPADRFLQDWAGKSAATQRRPRRALSPDRD
jgi:EAL domain-containing protein (putative c-di-GMP-specific phosphodiesterase class I)